MLAADQVAARGGFVIAGGVESASTPTLAQLGSGRRRPTAAIPSGPVRSRRASRPRDGRRRRRPGRGYGIDREAQDAYAARSHARAVATAAAGGFDAELVPLTELDHDERPRPAAQRQKLARLAPAFGEHGTVTLGNSCGINDGAAAVAMLDPDRHAGSQRLDWRSWPARPPAWRPDRPGFGIVPAVQQALDRAKLRLDDVAVIEFNEAFAGQILACCPG